MGSSASKQRELEDEDSKRVLIVGLDHSGKTTILYTLHLGEDVTETVPTIGFNVAQVVHNNIVMSIWDLGGQGQLRSLWHHYYKGVEAVVFVVDSADRARLALAASELRALLAHKHLERASVLVLANKQDLPDALSLEAIKQALAWNSIVQRCHLEGTVGVDGTGLKQAMDWLTSQLDSSPSTTAKSRRNSIEGSSGLPGLFNTASSSYESVRLPVLTKCDHDNGLPSLRIAPFVTSPRNKKGGSSVFPTTTGEELSVVEEKKYSSAQEDGEGSSEEDQASEQDEVSSSGSVSQLAQTLVLTLAETAIALNVTQLEALGMLVEGYIKGKRVGGQWRISTRTVLEYLESDRALTPSLTPGDSDSRNCLFPPEM
eukprot:CAMPEP_0175157846 /NCGR_PEP_ID=MMETSP0087-20121206/22461_1 /TAXON_ID=136419 /ORGANISM="Unknown Unknown, Strain D1" /LENGTH=371 /DNA_ID=CAMNT_0016445565 /DNA_START=173 /DNA_END=1288 /DNA_ORIENTATION=-